MSREIKFRGKTKDGRWVQGVPIKNGFGKLTFICFATSDLLSCPMEQIYKFCVEVVPETVTQYTGLYDSTATEFCEGDILEDDGEYWEVEFYDGAFWVVAIGGTAVAELLIDNDYMDLVGNIYENPELLEDAE